MGTLSKMAMILILVLASTSAITISTTTFAVQTQVLKEKEKETNVLNEITKIFNSIKDIERDYDQKIRMLQIQERVIQNKIDGISKERDKLIQKISDLNFTQELIQREFESLRENEIHCCSNEEKEWSKEQKRIIKNTNEIRLILSTKLQNFENDLQMKYHKEIVDSNKEIQKIQEESFHKIESLNKQAVTLHWFWNFLKLKKINNESKKLIIEKINKIMKEDKKIREKQKDLQLSFLKAELEIKQKIESLETDGQKKLEEGERNIRKRKEENKSKLFAIDSNMDAKINEIMSKIRIIQNTVMIDTRKDIEIANDKLFDNNRTKLELLEEKGKRMSELNSKLDNSIKEAILNLNITPKEHRDDKTFSTLGTYLLSNNFDNSIPMSLLFSLNLFDKTKGIKISLDNISETSELKKERFLRFNLSVDTYKKLFEDNITYQLNNIITEGNNIINVYAKSNRNGSRFVSIMIRAKGDTGVVQVYEFLIDDKDSSNHHHHQKVIKDFTYRVMNGWNSLFNNRKYPFKNMKKIDDGLLLLDETNNEYHLRPISEIELRKTIASKELISNLIEQNGAQVVNQHAKNVYKSIFNRY
ncbi:MAG: hypothetical protein HQK49_05030 [Oligoflexia bacterium]|nr:hypothetical protein [Oligoflexia bacterium]